MVDFSNPETITNTPEDLVKKIILENLIFVEEAIECYNQAIEIDPEYALAWNNKGIALKALGSNKEAEYASNKAKELENQKSIN